MTEEETKRILLIDGNALIHRSFHALPPLTTKKGELVNAVFGFTSILLKAIKDLKPTHIAVAFDAKGPTFRHKEYKEYKATRVAAPEELYQQIPRVKEIVQAFNIPFYEAKGFEADDIIGTLSKKIDIENIIVTGDLDELQLVDENTKVYMPKRGVQDTVLYDDEKVKERYELSPEQLIDFKGLRGDPSDNIPGVKGIGEKTAIKLLKQFGTIEKMYQRLGKGEVEGVPEKLRKLLLESKRQALLSKRLATIVTDMDLKFDLEKARITNYDREKVVKLFQELGFKSLLKRLPESETKKVGQQGQLFSKEKDSTFEKTKASYHLIKTQREFLQLIENLRKKEEIAIDTETTSTTAVAADLLGISFSWKADQAFYLPAEFLLKWKNLKDRLKEILTDKNIKKIGHNIKYDLIVLKKFGIDLAGIYFDTMIASYLLSPGTRKHSLDDLAFSEFGYEMMSYEDLVGKEAKDIREVSLEKLSFYSCEDVDMTWRLKQVFAKKLSKEKKLERIFYEIEMPLVSVLADMEINGIKIDIDFLKKLSVDFEKEIKELEKKIYDLAGCQFNVRSPVQLKEVLFNKLKISSNEVKRIKTGLSTAASELAKLRKAHPIIKLIEQHREYTKLKSTYLDALPNLVNKRTGRVHTSFNQTITATGRLSSSDPNLQNIPIRTDIGRQIRKAFITDSGFKILSADYSQIELRLAAHISGDSNMLEAFENDEDIHLATAAKIFNKNLESISLKERRFAKTINFGILYGMSPYGLSQALEIEKEEAKRFIDQYFENFPSIAVYIKQTLDFARQNGYVETLLGRRRYLPELKSESNQVRAAAERMAINHPIQGTAADIIKMAMNEVYQKNLVSHPDCRLLLQVHDELVFEIKEDRLDELAKEIKEIMEGIYKLEIPLKVDLSFGNNWGELKEIKN